MTWAAIKKTDGLSVIASNTIKNSGGGDVVVSDDVLDTGAATHTIFGATVAVDPVPVVNFIVTANRIFEA